MNRDMLKENRIHGDTIFPLGIYSIVYNNESIVLDCHWHEEMEFLLVTKGRATFQIETDYFEIAEGEAIFINSGVLHAGYPIDKSKCNFTAIVFNPDMLYNHNIYDPIQVKFIEPIIKKLIVLPKHIKGINEWEKLVLSHLSKIISVIHSKPFTYELSIKASLYNIFSLIISNTDINAHNENYFQNNYKSERFKKIMLYIYENYNKKITIKGFSTEFNMSEGHFCRFFKQMARRTPIDFINYYRINKAVKLLEYSSIKIIEISIDVGFENVSYFTSTFKHYMKCTPTEYRKANRNKT
jgi:AraC-like DNA-binding protein